MEVNLQFWRGRKVLITGHTGFKGAWLSLWLESLGAEIAGYSLLPPTQPNLFDLARVGTGMCSTIGDVRDLKCLSRLIHQHKPSVIFHLAAQSLVRRSYAQPVETYATNIMGTVHLLESARDAPFIKAIIVVTSDKCYENSPESRPFQETDRLGGRDPYSSSKAAAELVTSAFRASFFTQAVADRKIGIASVRAGNVIGGGDWSPDRLIPDVMRAALGKSHLHIRNPHAIRPWQHVLDPLCGYLMLAEKLCLDPSHFSDSWNFGPELSDTLPVSEVLNRLQALWGSEIPWQTDAAPHLHEEAALRLNCHKAKTVLGWKSQWNLHDALAKTVEWYKAFSANRDLRSFTLEQIRTYQSSNS